MNDRELPSDPAERPSVGERATQRTPAGAADDPRQPTLGLSPLAPRARSPLQLAPGDLLGSFRIERQLGRGAMGIVWQAYDTVGERAVVVKVLPAELQHSTDEMARVKHAFQRVQSLQHQHICPVYLLGEEPALGYYLVMRYVAGTTLAAFQHEQWARQGAFSLEQVCRVLTPVALALDYAHAQKVVHRDVKPQNIMVAEDGADVQVVDFGLAAEIRTSITRVSRVQMDSSGTYPYMAPEQWRGEYQDGQADQYALGVVAFELLTGRLPYQAPDDFVLRQCVLHEPVPEITHLSPAVNQALARAMAKSRELRFQTCIDFIRALENPPGVIISGSAPASGHEIVSTPALPPAVATPVLGPVAVAVPATNPPVTSPIVSVPAPVQAVLPQAETPANGNLVNATIPDLWFALVLSVMLVAFPILLALFINKNWHHLPGWIWFPLAFPCAPIFLYCGIQGFREYLRQLKLARARLQTTVPGGKPPVVLPWSQRLMGELVVLAIIGLVGGGSAVLMVQGVWLPLSAPCAIIGSIGFLIGLSVTFGQGQL